MSNPDNQQQRNALRVRSPATKHLWAKVDSFPNSATRKILVINPEKTTGRVMDWKAFRALDLSEIGEWDIIYGEDLYD